MTPRMWQAHGNYDIRCNVALSQQSIKQIMVLGSHDSNELKDHLQSYTYAQFEASVKQFLFSGRMVWQISGNLTESQAIDIVERTRDTLSLKNIDIEDILHKITLHLPFTHLVKSTSRRIFDQIVL